MRPFRFLADPGEAADGPSIAEAARRAEAIGYSAIVYPDHLGQPLGFLPLLTWAAAATDRIRVMPFVANNDLRHPTILAQDLASIDVLSGGRLEVAMGAGWNRPEYDAIGLPFDPVGVRVSRLAEALAVSRAASATARSRSPATTTRSPTTTASRSPSSARTRRCSSVAAAGGC